MEINGGNLEKLEELLRTKAWDELTTAERELVMMELGSEEEYTLMRRIGLTLVSQKSDLSPDPFTVRKLQAVLKEKHPASLWSRLVGIQVPAYALFILLTVVIVIFSWRTDTRPNATAEHRVVVKTDTVYLPAKTDTVYVERVIVKHLPSKEKAVPVFTATTSPKSESPAKDEGVNMNENEELEKLLVSGS